MKVRDFPAYQVARLADEHFRHFYGYQKLEMEGRSPAGIVRLLPGSRDFDFAWKLSYLLND